MVLSKNLEDIRNNILKAGTPDFEVDEHIEKIKEIQKLKQELNVICLGHNYMRPEVFYGVSDYIGDSLYLAKKSSEINSDSNNTKTILLNGVYFMAETVKVLNPNAKVLIADRNAGCSLADSINRQQVRDLKKQYPNVPVICYVNCTADVKAECYSCCTSSNANKIALEVAKDFNTDTVMLIPDKFLAKNVKRATNLNIISYEKGSCQVHELYTKDDIVKMRKQFDDLIVVSHPECDTEITENSDFAGSTSEMESFIKSRKEKNVFLITECGMSDNLRSALPEKFFISTCHTCPFMKMITLDKIIQTLKNPNDAKYCVTLSNEVIMEAKQSIYKMLELSTRN